MRIPTCLMVLAALSFASCGGSGSGGSEGENEPDPAASTFSKSYGGPLHDEASVVLNTEDGGFLLLGSADGAELMTHNHLQPGAPGAPLGGDFWLQKLDANGNVEHSRTFGLHTASPTGTTWNRARPTADGGVILVGEHARTEVFQRPEGTETLVVSRDIAVARLDADGNTLWSVTHDSGAWLNYQYFQRNELLAAARDFGGDVWPLEDGGFLVAGTSIANLEDSLDIGFPCDDEELLIEITLREQWQPSCAGGGPDGSNRFIDASSVVVLRLNADGTLRWIRRFTDNPYDTENNVYSLGVTIRSTTDGGAVLARAVGRGSALVRRLAADGSPLWRTALHGALPPSSTWGGPPPPADLIQTDDPVDGRDGDLYDGERDDGFALAGRERVIQLNADGSVRWSSAFTIDGNVSSESRMFISSLTQHCDYGRPTRCDLVVAGSRERGFVAFLDEDGDVRDHILVSRAVPGAAHFSSFQRISAARDGRFELVGRKSSGNELALVSLPAPPGALALIDERPVEGADLDNEVAELRNDGGLLLFNARDVGQLRFIGARGQQQATVHLAVGSTSSEVLRAAAQIGPGRFVLAGTQRAPNGQTGILLLRYDLDASGAEVIWRRRLSLGIDDREDVLAATADGEGGVVLSLRLIPLSATAESGARGQLLRLDADGNPDWQLALPGAAQQLQRTPDGGFAALSSSFEDSQVRVTRISAQGARLWQNSVSLDEGQGAVETMTVTSDGGMVLAGSFASRIALVRLAPEGTLLGASDVTLPFTSRGAIYFDDLRLRQSADGFVLAMTETGLFTDTSPDSLPLGASNVLVLKLDPAFQPVWSRVYGGLYDEGARDLALRDDGTIAMAGYSDSLGDRREAWLLKLSPHGLVSDAGCQALLGSIAPQLVTSVPRTATVLPSAPVLSELAELPPFASTNVLMFSPQDFVTARQCLGDARAGRAPPPPPALQRLTVLQVGTQRGVVTSTPTGISCGTGLDICAADFAQGSRVSLRADPEAFVAWHGDCDEGTGGTSLECVILLDRNRSMQVEFGAPLPPPPPPPPPPIGETFRLEFTVLGRGFVSTDGDDGIVCNENDSVQTCSRNLPAGTVVNAMAVPDVGLGVLTWGGGGIIGDRLCLSFGRERSVQFTVDRDIRCQLQFGPEDPRRMLVLDVSGGGRVRHSHTDFPLRCREISPLNECRDFLDDGTFVQLFAEAEDGWQFGGWGGDCASGNTALYYQFAILQDTLCSATFVRDIVTLTVVVDNATGGRDVTSQPAGIECTSDGVRDCTGDFALGSMVTLRAAPQGFLSWQGCNRVVDINFCEITMSQSNTVTARFAP